MEGVTVIGAAPAAPAPAPAAPAAAATTTAASTPAAPVVVPAAPAPVLRTVATTPRPVATEPRTVATTPRPLPAPAPAVPAAGSCPSLPADLQPYFTGPNPRCGPQAVHPGDALRTGALEGGAPAAEPRQIVRYEVNPPPGYRAAWDDGRMNPYRGLSFGDGQRQMEQVWTNTVPRRLVGDAPRGFAAVTTRANRPARLVPAELVVIRP
jgi:hypothetical protein